MTTTADKQLMASMRRAWGSMKGRCLNPNDKDYRHYGGRGIGIDPRWLTFENFLSDMGPRPSPTHTLDRKDVDGDYGPENCRWATRAEQARNMRTNVHICFMGQTKIMSEWARHFGMKPTTLWNRLRSMSLEEATTNYKRQRHRARLKARASAAASAQKTTATENNK